MILSGFWRPLDVSEGFAWRICIISRISAQEWLGFGDGIEDNPILDSQNRSNQNPYQILSKNNEEQPWNNISGAIGHSNLIVMDLSYLFKIELKLRLHLQLDFFEKKSNHDRSWLADRWKSQITNKPSRDVYGARKFISHHFEGSAVVLGALQRVRAEFELAL